MFLFLPLKLSTLCRQLEGQGSLSPLPVHKLFRWIDAADRGKLPSAHSSPAAACVPMERPKVIAVPCEVATTGDTGYSAA